MITCQRVRELFFYDPVTGHVFKKNYGVRHGQYFGRPIGGFDSRGYRRCVIDGRAHLLHRIIWLHVYGEWPTQPIDHINRDKGDNRLCNLRLVTHKQNGINQGVRSNNTSGFRGVATVKGRYFCAKVQRDGKRVCLPLRRSAEDAAVDYISEMLRINGEFFADYIRREAANEPRGNLANLLHRIPSI